jgi:hypothetical protein
MRMSAPHGGRAGAEPVMLQRKSWHDRAVMLMNGGAAQAHGRHAILAFSPAH